MHAQHGDLHLHMVDHHAIQIVFQISVSVASSIVLQMMHSAKKGFNSQYELM